MAHDLRGPGETEIPWWGYLIVAMAIALVIVAGVIVWHLIAVLQLTPVLIA
jgi:hypothetical protein